MVNEMSLRPKTMLIFEILTVLLLFVTITTPAAVPQTDEAELSNFLTEVNKRLAKLYNHEVFASWQNEIKGPHELVALFQQEIAQEQIMSYLKSIADEVTRFKQLNITDENLKRELEQIPTVGYDALASHDLELMIEVTTNMSDVFENINLCSFNNPDECDLKLIPDVQNILDTSKNMSEIQWYWMEWRREAGLAAKEDFIKFVELYRKTAMLNGYEKPSDYWYKNLEDHSSETPNLLEKVMEDLRPLYQQFHAFVRAALRTSYGEDMVPRGKPYPNNLADIFIHKSFQKGDPAWNISLPYPAAGVPNVTAGLQKLNLSTQQDVFVKVADFFASLGMPKLEPDFWKSNAQPKADLSQAEMTCWSKAWKYYGLNRVEFSYCPNVSEERFYDMFEAVSDVYYNRAYAKQPTLFEEEPIPNFSDGVGKLFSLAASSPKYLEKINITNSDYTSKEARINRLYVLGLRTIFPLPLFFVIDRYRVEVLDGNISLSDNCAYWNLTETYVGAQPPVQRTNADFDAPAKLLNEVDEQYSSQIMSTVLEFQLFKHYCTLAGQYKPDDPTLPLDLCDLSDHHEIGPIIFTAMSMGSSKSYNEILKSLTNESELKLDGFLEYFKPLYDWLATQNSANDVEIGWDNSDRCTPN